MTEPAIPGDHSQLWSRRIVAKASWTILDQALFALANFAGNVVLARWLTPVEYGGYTTATALFWMVLSAYSGLLSDPMMVFGSSRFRDRLSSYFAVLANFHWCICAMVSAGFAAVGLVLMLRGPTVPGSSFLGYALAVPAVLLLWLVRRTVYLWSHPRLAAAAGGVYMAGMLAIMYMFYRTGTLSSFTAPLAAAGASAFAISTIIAARPFRLWSSWQGDFVRQVAVAHWRYGRWMVVAGMASWAPTAVYYLLIVPVLVGLEGNGALNALWNLVMPAIQAGLAFALLLVPAFGRAREDQRAASLIWSALFVMLAGAALYALLVGLFGGPVMDLVYGERYTQYSHFAWLVGVAALPNAAIAVFESVLRAHERPDLLLWAYVVSTAVTCVVGVAAVAEWGVLGGVLGLLARDVTTALVELCLVLRAFHSPDLRPTLRLSR